MNPNHPVKEIMTKRPVTINKTDAISKVESLFDHHRFHHLPVVEQGQLVGIITREDYYKKRDDVTSVAEMMTKYPMELDPDDTIGLAADIFLSNQFHSLPVVEDGELIGIVTTHDLLSFSFQSPVETEREDE